MACEAALTLALRAMQDVCRDPVIQKAYAEDPLCVQVGSFRGISDMLLGVRFVQLVSSQPTKVTHALSRLCSQGEALMKTGWKSWPKDLPLLIVHGEADKVRLSCSASLANED